MADKSSSKIIKNNLTNEGPDVFHALVNSVRDNWRICVLQAPSDWVKLVAMCSLDYRRSPEPCARLPASSAKPFHYILPQATSRSTEASRQARESDSRSRHSGNTPIQYCTEDLHCRVIHRQDLFGCRTSFLRVR